MAGVTSGRSPSPGRDAVVQAVHDLVFGVIRRAEHAGTSVVVTGAPGIGKTFLVQRLLAGLAPGEAEVLRVAGEQGRRRDPFTAAAQILGALPTGTDPADAAFDRVDELCAAGPVLLCAEDAHYLDAASLTLLRRLVWASRNLPLAVLVTTRPDPSREPLAMLTEQAAARLWLPPMGRMLVERLVFEATGRWPGPVLRRVLDQAGGNPMFAGELLRGYAAAGALTEPDPATVEAKFELSVQVTGLDGVLRGHLDGLGEPARDVLDVLAVWGTEATAEDLAGLLFTSAAALSEALDGAVASGLLRREPSGAVAFTHDLFREVTYGELPPPRRRSLHQQAARALTAAGYSPALVADHLLRAAQDGTDPALVPALRAAVDATRAWAPEVTADLLDDADALGGQELPSELLPDRVEALFLRGRGQAAEQLVRERIGTVTDPAVAARLQVTVIRSLANRAEMTPVLAAIDRTLAIPGLPVPVAGDLGSLRRWLLLMAGTPPPAADVGAQLARYAAAGLPGPQAGLLSAQALAAYLAGDAAAAARHLAAREELLGDGDSFRSRSSMLFLPATVALDLAGPQAARTVLEQTRRQCAERSAGWVDPFLGFVAGGIALLAGDWHEAVAELDAALERAEETGTGWILGAVGNRAWIDAHRGQTGAARARLESFRHRGYPLQWAQDRPGLAELAILEAEGALREAATLAGTLWSSARDTGGRWAADLAPEVTRIAIVAMDRRLATRLGDDVPRLCPPGTARLVGGMIAADPDALGASAAQLAASGLHTAEAFAREELACAAATAGDRDRASAELDAALAGYQRMGAVPDRDRALSRLRALGVRRGSREPHREAVTGWASLTPSEARIAALVRDGLTNREIGTRLFVSPRTVQTHISHILQKTSLRSRVEITRALAGPPRAVPAR